MSLCEAVIFLLCQTCHCYEHLNESRDICPWCSSLFKVRKSVQLVGTRVACMLNWDILYSTNKHTFSLVPRYWQKIFLKYIMWGDFPDGPVVNTPCFQCTSMGLNPGQGTKIPDALKCSQGGEKDVDWSTNFKYGYLIFFSTICWRQSFLHGVVFASSSKRICPCTCGSISGFPFCSTHLFIYLDTNTTLPWLL